MRRVLVSGRRSTFSLEEEGELLTLNRGPLLIAACACALVHTYYAGLLHLEMEGNKDGSLGPTLKKLRV